MILDLFKLDGKVAVVTGANTGLGQGMAVALAEAGAKVVGVNNRSGRYRTFRCIGRIRQSRYSGK